MLKKDVPLLPLSFCLGAKRGQKRGLGRGRWGGLDVHVPSPIASPSQTEPTNSALNPSSLP